MVFSMLGVPGSAPGCRIDGVDSEGREKTFNISDFRGRFLVLVFYHADWDCVDILEAFAELGSQFQSCRSELVFCSTDNPRVHASWLKSDREDGGFGGWLGGKVSGLWSDPSGSLALQYDLFNEEDNECMDGVVIIDEEGLIRHVMTSSMDHQETAHNTLDILRMLKAYAVNENEVKETSSKVLAPQTPKKKVVPQTEKSQPIPPNDWNASEDPKLLKALKIAEKLGLPSPPKMLYCQKKPVFDLTPIKIRRLVNPKAALVSCSASLHRNLIGFEDDQSLQLENTMKRIFGNENMPDDLAGSFTSVSCLSFPEEKQFLESPIMHLTSRTNLLESISQRADGQGIFVNNYKNLLAWVNFHDHLHLESVAEGQDIKYVLLRLQKAATKIEEVMKSCGMLVFLTSNGCFNHQTKGISGTGFQVSFCLQLPGFQRAGKAELEKVETELGLCVEHRNNSLFSVELEQKIEHRELDIVTKSVEGVDSLWRKDMELQSKYGIRLSH